MESYRGGRFGITVGDITKVPVDAIVNSTNQGFAAGFGVDFAIREAAGPEMNKACAALGSAGFAEARVTPGFALQAKHVVHVVAPIYKGGDKGEVDLLAKAYTNALDAARGVGAKSIAFPAISTGTYAFPIEQAAGIALEAAKAYADANPDAFEQIVFVPYTAADGEVYTRLAATTFA